MCALLGRVSSRTRLLLLPVWQRVSMQRRRYAMRLNTSLPLHELSDREISCIITAASREQTAARFYRIAQATKERALGVHVVFENLTAIHNALACTRTAEVFGLYHIHLIATTPGAVGAATILCHGHAPRSGVRVQEAPHSDVMDDMQETNEEYMGARPEGAPKRAVEEDVRHKAMKNIAKGATQWLNITTHRSTKECLNALSDAGVCDILASDVSGDALPVDEACYAMQKRMKNHSLTPYNDAALARRSGGYRCAVVFGNERDGISNEMRRAATARFEIPMLGMTASLNLSVAFAITLSSLRHHRVLNGEVERMEMGAIMDEVSSWDRHRQDVLLKHLIESRFHKNADDRFKDMLREVREKTSAGAHCATDC